MCNTLYTSVKNLSSIDYFIIRQTQAILRFRCLFNHHLSLAPVPNHTELGHTVNDTSFLKGGLQLTSLPTRHNSGISERSIFLFVISSLEPYSPQGSTNIDKHHHFVKPLNRKHISANVNINILTRRERPGQ